MVRIKLVISLCLMFLISSCEQDDLVSDINKKEKEKEVAVVANPYKFKEVVMLKDGVFFVEYAVSANSKEKISSILSLRPRLEVKKTTKREVDLMRKEVKNSFDSSVEEDEDSLVMDPDGVSEFVLSTNIPSGYSYSIKLDTPDPKGIARRGSGDVTLHYIGSPTATLWKLSYATNLPAARIDFYTHGNNWYGSHFWYYRDTKHIGEKSNESEFSFKSKVHSSYPAGIEGRIKSTRSAWVRIHNNSEWLVE